MEGAWEFFYEGVGKAVAVSFHKGVPHGPIAMWHGNGQHAAEGRFVDGLPGGDWTYWHPNGAMQARGRFARGAREGTWTGWYSNKQMAVKMSFRGNVADGAYASWFENGKPRESGRISNGSSVGRWTRTCTGNQPSGTFDFDAALHGGVSGDFCNLQLTF
jgi:antitoxin component YwqK of YwqJK toxin-antitoxin module